MLGDFKRIVACQECGHGFGPGDEWSWGDWLYWFVYLPVAMLVWWGNSPMLWRDATAPGGRRWQLASGRFVTRASVCPKCGAEDGWLVDTVGQWDAKNKRWRVKGAIEQNNVLDLIGREK